MKKMLLIAMLILFATTAACSTTYIRIKKPVKLSLRKEYSFTAYPGDILKVIAKPTCYENSDMTPYECWKVMNIKTGDIGNVRAESIKLAHEVYVE